MESIELAWQDKIFSQTEMKYYAQKDNCETELEKRYHDMIKEKNEESFKNSQQLIYTYVHDDGYVPIEFRQIEKKSEISKINHVKDGFIEMHIMADLEVKILLFTIKYRQSDGLFLVYPDFNEAQNSYYIEIDQNSKQIYTYFLENISGINKKTIKQHKKEESLRNVNKETCDVMNKFKFFSRDVSQIHMPLCRIILLIEIISAKNFDSDSLHVEYKVKLPKFLKVSEGSLEGSTHSSFKNNNQWHFGYGFCISLGIEDEFTISSIDLEKITIIFNVVTIDSLWKRERHEGVAILNLPIKSLKKNFHYDLRCLRYVKNGKGLLDMLERFFLGGIRALNDSNHDIRDVSLNLYGNTTLSAGSLDVKIQVIRENKSSYSINTRLRSIDDIIDSYRKAKEKLNL